MNRVDNLVSLKQRSDYTYKFNSKNGRHGWLRLTPAYSLKIVEEVLAPQTHTKRVLDPFCGTGTTALSAAYHNHESVTIDVNPFLIWLAQAKIAHYTPNDLSATRSASALSLDLVKTNAVHPAPVPPIHNIKRWWNPKALEFLCLLKAAISAATTSHSAERNLLMVAFCQTLINLSAAAFNHQSMSFKTGNQLTMPFNDDMAGMFAEDVQFVLAGAIENPSGPSCVVLGNSKDLTSVVAGDFDLIVTSPPYVNRMSYIRELRPYMYWLDFLKDGRDAGELDWATIGGTWGVATSRLTDWQRPAERFDSLLLEKALDKIAHAENKNGVILANYVAKYFDDMWAHFQSILPILSPCAEIHYIVGNSSFYDNLVSTELLYAEMLTRLGFNQIESRPIRKRNSKRELVEFDVTAKWNNS